MQSWTRARENCSECGYDFVREPGFYLGSIYVNYGLTAGILLAVCTPIVLFTNTSYTLLTPFAVGFCIVFPIWFHRYARAIWLGFDYRWDGFQGGVKAPSVKSSAEQRSPDSSKPAANTSNRSNDPRTVMATCPFCHARNPQDPSKLNTWVACGNCSRQILVASSKPPGSS